MTRPLASPCLPGGDELAKFLMPYPLSVCAIRRESSAAQKTPTKTPNAPVGRPVGKPTAKSETPIVRPVERRRSGSR